MGFASKLEDEIERRAGELPRYELPPILPLFGSMGTDGIYPERIRGLGLDAITTAKISKLAVSIEESRKQKESAGLRLYGGGKQLEKWLKARDKHARLLRELIEILAPRIRKMRGGRTKRYWQRLAAELEKAKYR